MAVVCLGCCTSLLLLWLKLLVGRSRVVRGPVHHQPVTRLCSGPSQAFPCVRCGPYTQTSRSGPPGIIDFLRTCLVQYRAALAFPSGDEARLIPMTSITNMMTAAAIQGPAILRLPRRLVEWPAGVRDRGCAHHHRLVFDVPRIGVGIVVVWVLLIAVYVRQADSMTVDYLDLVHRRCRSDTTASGWCSVRSSANGTQSDSCGRYCLLAGPAQPCNSFFHGTQRYRVGRLCVGATLESSRPSVCRVQPDRCRRASPAPPLNPTGAHGDRGTRGRGSVKGLPEGTRRRSALDRVRPPPG